MNLEMEFFEGSARWGGFFFLLSGTRYDDPTAARFPIYITFYLLVCRCYILGLSLYQLRGKYLHYRLHYTISQTDGVVFNRRRHAL